MNKDTVLDLLLRYTVYRSENIHAFSCNFRKSLEDMVVDITEFLVKLGLDGEYTYLDFLDECDKNILNNCGLED